MPKSEVPRYSKQLAFAYYLRAKANAHNEIERYRMRGGLRGDLQQQYLHVSPEKLSPPVADLDAMRITLVDAFSIKYIAEHRYSGSIPA